MTTDDLKLAIVDKIGIDIPEYIAELFPDDPKNYNMIHPNGALLVSYAGSTYNGKSGNQQVRLMSYEVTIISKNLNGNLGVDAMVDRVRQSVTSDFNIGQSSFYAVGDNPQDNIDDLWYHRILFMLPIPLYVGE